jgi:hypothetical protein
MARLLCLGTFAVKYIRLRGIRSEHLQPWSGQFNLRTLLRATTVVAVVLGAVVAFR